MTIRRSATYVGNDRVLLRAANAFKYFVDARDVSIAPHLIVDGVYEEHVERTLRAVVKPGMHVFEVGANIGYFTVLLAHLTGTAGSVASFEADPALVQIARDNIEINGFHRVAHVEHRAVSDSVGEAAFYTRDRHRGNGSLLADLEQLPWNSSDAKTAVTVPTITLDAYIAQSGVMPDFIKIDAEGAEPAILRGARTLLAGKRKLTMILEFFPEHVRAAGDDPADFLKRLRRCGFRLRYIDERTRKIRSASSSTLLARTYSELILTR